MTNVSAASAPPPNVDVDVEFLRETPALFGRLKAELGRHVVGRDNSVRDLFVF